MDQNKSQASVNDSAHSVISTFMNVDTTITHRKLSAAFDSIDPDEIKTEGAIERMLLMNRGMPSVPPPNWEPLPHHKVFDSEGVPIVNNLKAHFLREGLLSEQDALSIIHRSSELLKQEPNLLHLTDPIVLCGDIHGQYYDMCKMLKIGGDPKDTQYLFLGDYVDRGCFGCEVVLLLFAYKIKYPHTFYLLRGNHECRHLTEYFNCKQETLLKYGNVVYEALLTAFNCLPLAAILNNKIFCVHGGISPEIEDVNNINKINRFREAPCSGAMCDFLWSDPMEEDMIADKESLYAHNELRGCSYVYSYKAVCKFLHRNKLLSIVRAHEAQDNGFRLYKKINTGFPSVVCIFSAPNYCDTYNNKAAITSFKDNRMNIHQFNSSPHPYCLPNFMNAFSWSLPFVAEKLTNIVTIMWELCDRTIDEHDDDAGEDNEIIVNHHHLNNSNYTITLDDKNNQKKGSVIGELARRMNKTQERHQLIRTRIMTMERMGGVFRSLRERNENIINLKGLAGPQLPQEVMSQRQDDVRKAISDFEYSKLLDQRNERMPNGK